MYVFLGLGISLRLFIESEVNGQTRKIKDCADYIIVLLKTNRSVFLHKKT